MTLPAKPPANGAAVIPLACLYGIAVCKPAFRPSFQLRLLPARRMHPACLVPSFLELEGVLSANPLAGELIVGTGGARKLRLGGKGKGKSGGYRTIHYYAGDDVPVFLLAVLSKGDRANISKAERNELAKVLPTLADAYKAAMRAKEKRK